MHTLAPPEDLLGLAEGALMGMVSQLLGLGASDINPEDELSNYGFDSISASQFVATLGDMYQLPLTAAVVFEHSSLRSLAKHLLAQYPEAFARQVKQEESAKARPEAAAAHPHPAADDRKASPATASHGTVEPIAIIALSGQFPQARDVDEFWANLQTGRDCITEIPADRGSLEDFYSADIDTAISEMKSYSKSGGFIGDVEGFDYEFFNMSQPEAESNGPKVSLFLETVWTLLERAGYTRETLRKLAGSKVGVYVGAMPGTYTRFEPQFAAATAPPRLATIANRVSHYFNCTGPSIAVDTMSSSAMTAIHMACESLRHRECEMAIAGGVSLLHPQAYVQASQRRMLARQLDSRSFGSGGGLILSECVGAVLLKPLSSAQRDGDSVLAVITSSVSSHSGGAIKYSLLNPNAQAHLIHASLRRAEIHPRTISYVEAAANGTPLSDAVEVNALSKAFAGFTGDKQFCTIGSAESNVGHTGPATGITQLAKVVLQLMHGQLVPSIKVAPSNRDLRFEETPFHLQSRLTEWKRPTVITGNETTVHPRRAMINSVGGGGAYVNLIVEEHAAREEEQPALSATAGPFVFVMSARTGERLQAVAQNLLRWLDGREDVPLEDVAYTLQIGREEMKSRLAVVAAERSELVRQLTQYLGTADREEPVESGIFVGEVSRPAQREPYAPPGPRVSGESRDELQALAAHWVAGGRVDWEQLPRRRAVKRITLPTYPFARPRATPTKEQPALLLKSQE